MIKWKVENGVLSILFENEDDIRQFVDTVLKGPASQLGLEIELKKASKTVQQGQKTQQKQTIRL